MKMKRNNAGGFTLIETVIVIIIMGILATVAMRNMSSSIETARVEQTKDDLDALALAIAGDPSLYTKGARSDYGYVGDVGALPPNLNALVQNPGGLGTWQGPYITRGMGPSVFGKDAWGADYVYTDTLIRSTGSGSNIDKVFANSSAGLLSNTVRGYIADADLDLPGVIYRDSLVIQLLHPDGGGAITTDAANPDALGNFAFSGIAVGNHTLLVIYVPDSDTVTYRVSVNPDRPVRLEVSFPADLW